MKKRWLTAIAYLILIHSLSSFSLGNSEIEIFYGFDKIIHILEYFVLTILFWKPICNFFSQTSINTISFGIFLFSILNGFLDEYHQGFGYGRDSTYGDFLADVIGSAFGVLCLRFRNKNNAYSETKFGEIFESN